MASCSVSSGDETLDISTTLATFSAVTGSAARFVKTTALAIDWSESDAVVAN